MSSHSSHAVCIYHIPDTGIAVNSGHKTRQIGGGGHPSSGTHEPIDVAAAIHPFNHFSAAVILLHQFSIGGIILHLTLVAVGIIICGRTKIIRPGRLQYLLIDVIPVTKPCNFLYNKRKQHISKITVPSSETRHKP